MKLDKRNKLETLSKYIGEVVYGGIDGIVTTFAVVAGFVGAGATNTLGEIGPLAVVLFGLANLFGDGVSMGLGKFLSTKSQQDLYNRDYNNQINIIGSDFDSIKIKTKSILLSEGFSQEDSLNYINLLSSYPDIRAKWLMDNDLKIPDASDEKPFAQGLMTLVSFIIFGFIPLIPFIFTDKLDSWVISVVMTGVALIVLGLTRRAVTRSKFFGTVGQVILLGAVAAVVAYITGHFVARFM